MKNVIRAFGLLCLLGFLGGCSGSGYESSFPPSQQKNDRSNLPDAPQP